ncbi:MAG: hypothetical protein ACFE8P_08910 [Promethearchaeota archaeon]
MVLQGKTTRWLWYLKVGIDYGSIMDKNLTLEEFTERLEEKLKHPTKQ